MDTEQLLDRVVQGDSSAASALLSRHQTRLRRMVYLRIDPRLAARLDPSDIVQDALAEAHRRLPGYAAERPIPFYPWLRRIAWDRLLQMRRRHIEAKLSFGALKPASDRRFKTRQRQTESSSP
jgi:RNA polymerase sigma-70 factor (ECF subfamily)